VKKNRLIPLLGILLSFCLFSISSAAVDQKILIYVDGKKVSFPDQQPIINKDNRTLVPVRFVSETLGAKVGWNSKNKEVQINHEAKQKDIKLWVNKKNYTVNGESKTMDTKAELTKKSRVIVPLRFVSEGLGADVRWEVVLNNNVVHTFTLDQTEEEIKEIMEQVKKEIQGGNQPTGGKVIDVAKTGAEMKSMEWVVDQSSAVDFIPEAKINFITVDDLKKSNYKLNDGCTILDLRIDDKYIYVKQKGEGAPASMYLAEGNNLNRFRDADKFEYPAGIYETKHLIINDRRDQYIPMPTCNISKITHFVLMYGKGCIAVENPKYKGVK
jgi:hypothetical protein